MYPARNKKIFKPIKLRFAGLSAIRGGITGSVNFRDLNLWRDETEGSLSMPN